MWGMLAIFGICWVFYKGSTSNLRFSASFHLINFTSRFQFIILSTKSPQISTSS